MFSSFILADGCWAAGRRCRGRPKRRFMDVVREDRRRTCVSERRVKSRNIYSLCFLITMSFLYSWLPCSPIAQSIREKPQRIEWTYSSLQSITCIDMPLSQALMPQQLNDRRSRMVHSAAMAVSRREWRNTCSPAILQRFPLTLFPIREFDNLLYDNK